MLQLKEPACPSEDQKSHMLQIRLAAVKQKKISPWLSGKKKSTCSTQDVAGASTGAAGSIPGSGRSLGGRWQPTPVFLPGKSMNRGLQSVGLQKNRIWPRD